MTQRRNGSVGSLEQICEEIGRFQHDPDFELEQLLIRTDDRIFVAMEQQQVTRAELARRLGSSRAYITRLLGGQENVTLKTLVRVANALGAQWRLELAPRAAARRPARRRPAAAAMPARPAKRVRPQQRRRAAPARKKRSSVTATRSRR